jgi:hypothetical protein
VNSSSATTGSGPETANESGRHVKGTLVQGVVMGLRAMHGEETSAPAALEPRLSKPAFELLDAEIVGVGWYPIELYCELVDLFWELAGGRDPAFIREAGRAGAQSMIETGIYRSFIETGRVSGGDAVERAIRGVRVTTGVTRMLYDFVDVDVKHDAERKEIVLTYGDVTPFSDALFLGTQGFLDAFTAEVGILGEGTRPDEIPWRAERPSRDRFVFTLSLDRLG